MKLGLFPVLLTTCPTSSIFLLLHDKKTFLDVKMYSKCFPVDDEETLPAEEATVEKPTALSTCWMQNGKSYCVNFSFQEGGGVLQLKKMVWSH